MDTMKRANSDLLYCFDKKYFDGLQALGDKVHLCVVVAQQEVIAGCLLFECCGIVQAHLGGTRAGYRDQSPFSLLLHYARHWAKLRGNEVFHMGGGLGGAEDNVFSFKAGFSRQRHYFKTLRLVVDQANYDELCRVRARVLGVAVEQLKMSPYFPAYRSSPRVLVATGKDGTSAGDRSPAI